MRLTNVLFGVWSIWIGMGDFLGVQKSSQIIKKSNSHESD